MESGIESTLRAEQSKPVLDETGTWLMTQRALPRSALGKTIAYASGLWPGLVRFLAEPKIPLDTNSVERALRGVAVGRKNHYGSRSERGTRSHAISSCGHPERNRRWTGYRRKGDNGRGLTLLGLCLRGAWEDVAVGWEELEQWGDAVTRIEPLAGGVANDVWSVRVDEHLAVGRLSARSDADLAWETELLQHLDREGLTVPVPIPTTDGRLFAGGLVVMSYVEGGPPETEADWRRVADTLRQLHRLTQDWPQRPGWRSSTDLLHAETGTKIDLGSMPAEGVARCRAAWERLTGRQTCVVHGNPTNPGNVRVTADRVALIDWDESHVDAPDLDLALPYNAAGLDDDAHDIAAQASAAWEAAVCWDDEYAIRRLAEVRAV